MTLLLTACLGLVLARLAWIDLQTHRLPDRLTLPLIVAGLGIAALPTSIGPTASIVGGIAAYGLFWSVGWIYFARKGVEGLGLGDAKLFAACGTWLGISALPYVLLIASLGALIHTVTRSKGTQELAFGPWLALGFWVVWIALSI